MDFKDMAKELGRRGGLARSKNLTKERIIEIARNAGKMRWKNRKQAQKTAKNIL